MRILQLMFAISAFATTVNYTGFIDFMCDVPYKFSFEYPFNLLLNQELNLGAKNNCTPRVKISSDFSSDAKFFVASGVIAMLYCLFIMIVYTKFDNKYRTDNRLPVFDFFMTVFIAVLWVSSSASWANALANMKYISHDDYIQWDNLGICTRCPISVSSFSSLNVSVILGFLNFFLWATDLWFLYKETTWFQVGQISTSGEI